MYLELSRSQDARIAPRMYQSSSPYMISLRSSLDDHVRGNFGTKNLVSFPLCFGPHIHGNGVVSCSLETANTIWDTDNFQNYYRYLLEVHDLS